MKPSRNVHVKWISGNTVVIRNTENDRLYLTKKDLVDLIDEIKEFVEFYSKDFAEDRIGINDDLDSFDIVLDQSDFNLKLNDQK